MLIKFFIDCLDLASKRLSANLRRDDQTQFLGERNESTIFPEWQR